MNIHDYIKESNAIEDVHTDAAIYKSKEAWKYLKQQEELTVEVIAETHKRILEDRQPDIAGNVRSKPDEKVWIGTRQGTMPEHVQYELEELIDNQPSDHEEVLEWHVEFEKIHPFMDGNGRIGRMLYWWQCQKLDIEPVKFTASNRQEYYKLFRNNVTSRYMEV